MAPSSQQQTRAGRPLRQPARYADNQTQERDRGRQSAELTHALERRRRVVSPQPDEGANQPQAAPPGPVRQGGGGEGRQDETEETGARARSQPQTVAGVRGERVSIEDWFDPEVPGPHPGPIEEDATGWNRIDGLGVWDCMLCEFPTMTDIPGTYRHIWASSMAKVLQAIREAEGGLNLERALKWFLILPQALFRQGKRGGKAGKGLVGQRMNCLVQNDWGGECVQKSNYI